MTSVNSETNEEDAIPESILSLSKDARYIRQCQELLQDGLKELLEKRESLIASGSGGPGRQQELEQLRTQGTWLISCLLYLLVSIRSGRTLGMEALGLTFSSESRGRLATTSVANTRHGRLLIVGVSLLLTATGSLAWEYFSAAASSDDQDSNDGDSNNHERNPELLRGRERRLIHERLRRQMLERATRGNGSPVSEQHRLRESETEQSTGAVIRRQNSKDPISKRFSSVIRQLSTFAFAVYSNSNTGPHDVVQTGSDGDNATDSTNSVRSTSFSIALWIVRLHLAQYLVTGKYPTILHRLLGLEPKLEKTTGNDGVTTKPVTSILSRPNTNQAIGVLIFLQASATAAQTVSNWLARRVANYLETRALSARLENRDNDGRLAETKIRKKLEAVFADSANDDHHEKGAKLRMKQKPKGARMVCTICRMDRNHPAAPSSCGHVCCWNCLIQWVSTVRPECPLCRAPCRASDVIALHNYEPSHSKR